MPMYTKFIRYERSTKDFAMFLNGELIGYASTRQAAQEQLDRIVYDLLSHQSAAA